MIKTQREYLLAQMASISIQIAYIIFKKLFFIYYALEFKSNTKYSLYQFC